MKSAERTQPGRAKKACIKDVGPERQRWVNRSGYPMGAEVNKRNIRFRSQPARCSLVVWVRPFHFIPITIIMRPIAPKTPCMIERYATVHIIVIFFFSEARKSFVPRYALLLK